ncbi:GNAT family N-acetyltransferase [Peribacillus sp. SCS-155]|uniref:GNAT family N-acetyltransferase n=1 Tax=Peribacillus sedimenti TaxID=3115297 RepID=UPI003905BC79
MSHAGEIEIRSLYSIEDLEQVRKLESNIWGPEDSVPTHQTITAVKNGGLVLGAFLGDKLVGFQYSFPGFNGKEAYLCSHILATDQQFRNRKIGEKLKIAQREEALKLGYSLITWTYDPLESINGYLNISKLGAVCSVYIENCYGEMEDLLNEGLASDRFQVEWYINEQKKNTQEPSHTAAIENSLIQWEMDDAGLPYPAGLLPLTDDGEEVYVAIPKDFRGIRETDMELASKWRMASREIFTALFEQGWQVTGFLKNALPDIPVQFYVLSKK